MFKKSILQLHLKDKLFFLLVAILAIGGIYFGAKAAISYLSNPIEDHKEQLDQTNGLLTQLEGKHGTKLGTTLDAVKKTCTELQNGLIGDPNKNGIQEMLFWISIGYGIWVILTVLQLALQGYSMYKKE